MPSPKEISASLDQRWDNERHEMLSDSYPWLVTLREVLGAQDLFVYRHRFHGTFVLCQWIFKDVGTFNELEVFHDDPKAMWPVDLPPPEIMKAFHYGMEEAHKDRMKARRDFLAREEYLDEQGEYEKKDAVTYLKKKGLEEAARDIQCAATPWVPPCRSTMDNREETVKELTKMVKGL
jgi:hypothetical protein